MCTRLLSIMQHGLFCACGKEHKDLEKTGAASSLEGVHCRGVDTECKVAAPEGRATTPGMLKAESAPISEPFGNEMSDEELYDNQPCDDYREQLELELNGHDDGRMSPTSADLQEDEQYRSLLMVSANKLCHDLGSGTFSKRVTL